MAAGKKKSKNPLVELAKNPLPPLTAPKVPAVPKPTVKATVTRHHFDGNTIKVIGEKAPVREGSRRAEIFALFKDNMPLNEFLSAARKIRGGAPDVQIALDKKFIELV